MLKRKWISVTLRTNDQANAMLDLFKTLKPQVGATDTETDGLHIILNKPFVVQFGFLHPTENLGYTFAVDLERTPLLAKAVLKRWWHLAETLGIHLGHNIKFDLHMMTNIGLPPYQAENWSDTMFYIRYGHDALKPENGGPPLGLKDYTVRYIDHTAKHHERQLKQERSAIAKEYNQKLRQRLSQCGAPPAKYKARSYTLGVIKELFKDPTFEISDLPENIQQVYLDWLQLDLPIYLQKKVHSIVEQDMIPYNVLNRENLLKYAHLDIVYTLEVFEQLNSIVQYRGNMIGVEIENSLIMPLYEMERVGFCTDKEYLEKSRQDMRIYIRQRRQHLYELIGQEISLGQHALIKQLVNDKYDVLITSTNAEELNLLRSDLIHEDEHHPAVEFIDLLQELRTLEKWYSAYIIRFLKDLQNTDRLYTSINSIGTVSGRVTSDFQQFPKKPITTITGEELFYPRKMIKPSGGHYNALVYLDYSQIELRFQAMYTILVGHPDLNMCRAYMPYQCHNSTYNSFDCNNIEHIQNWNREWYLDEDTGTVWTPTDVHAATTMAATGLDKSDPKFASLRSTVGKKVNFAKNYGAQRARMRTMFPRATEEEVTRINDSYYTAFPGVKQYHNYCYGRAEQYSHTANLFGVKYYGVTGHKLINLLVQGSAAFFLKKKIRELYDYSKSNNIQSKWQMQIHDELSWERHDSETNVFFEFKRIMENWDDTLIPIVADMEVTKTTWSNKSEVNTVNELQTYLSN